MPKTIVIASSNPVKVKAAQEGFTRMFPAETYEIQSILVRSGVNDQPGTDQETRAGAFNRARNARAAQPEAHYWIGIEGGIEDDGQQMWAFAWVAILSDDRAGYSRTGIIPLPAKVANLVRAGKELGEADDLVFGRVNSKQQDGAVGILTGGALDRAGFYTQAVMLALTPFKNPELYQE